VLVFKILDKTMLDKNLPIDSEAVVEWRALTVFLVDRLTDSLRQKLNLDKNELPLGSALQGGSWAAGRRIAAELRPGGSLPLTLAIDGTIF
jgi:hypothetical protein